MSAALSRRLLISAALVSAAVVFVCFLLYERPGLGIGHFYYLAIALAAMAGGAAWEWPLGPSRPASTSQGC